MINKMLAVVDGYSIIWCMLEHIHKIKYTGFFFFNIYIPDRENKTLQDVLGYSWQRNITEGAFIFIH